VKSFKPDFTARLARTFDTTKQKSTINPRQTYSMFIVLCKSVAY
jgi:hypothetical protein